MADLSIIELSVYGFFAYLPISILVLSLFKELPDGRSQASFRIAFTIIGIICAFIIAQSGNEIGLTTTTELFNETIYNATTDLQFITNSTTTISNDIILINPIWVIFHLMLGISLIAYTIIQAVNVLTKI